MKWNITIISSCFLTITTPDEQDSVFYSDFCGFSGSNDQNSISIQMKITVHSNYRSILGKIVKEIKDKVVIFHSNSLSLLAC